MHDTAFQSYRLLPGSARWIGEAANLCAEKGKGKFKLKFNALKYDGAFPEHGKECLIHWFALVLLCLSLIEAFDTKKKVSYKEDPLERNLCTPFLAYLTLMTSVNASKLDK